MSKSSILSEQEPAKAREAEHELILHAGRTERHYWRNLWRYREFFVILAWRDVSVQYKQTVIQLHCIEIWRMIRKKQRWALEAANLLLCVIRDSRARALHWCDLPPECALDARAIIKRSFAA